MIHHDPHEKMKQLITKFVLTYNFWGYLFARVRRRSVEHYESIMGVSAESDGTICLNYNPELVAKTDENTIKTILSHEGMHLINKHLSRLIRIIANEMNIAKQVEKIDIYNIASDICANEQAEITKPLVVAGEAWPIETSEKYGFPPGETAEFYYIELLKMPKSNKKRKGDSGNGQSGFGNKAFDDHGGWAKDAMKSADKMTLSRKIEQFVGDIVREASKKYVKDRGSLPRGLEELINGALEPPKAPYYQIIQKYVNATRQSKFKRAFTRINRKRVFAFEFGYNNIPIVCPFPGKQRDHTYRIAIIKDTSGSMSVEEIRESLSGIKHLIEKDRYVETYVIDCDADVQEVYEVKRVSDIRMKAAGRGGTCLVPGLRYAKDEFDPDVALIFTDGGLFDCPNEVDPRFLPKKMIWAVSRDGPVESFNKRGFIVKLPYESRRR